MPKLIGITMSNTEALCALPRTYARAVLANGMEPFLLPSVHGLNADSIADAMDALLLAGGGDVEPELYGAARLPECGPADPDRDAVEIALTLAFARRSKPILGICRGIQVMNAAFGGTLHQHLPLLAGTRIWHAADETRHAVTITESSLLHGALGGRAMVNSTHHQAVAAPAPGFTVTALSEDNVIEGIENGNKIGVQWHPERILCEGMTPLFAAFARLIRS